MDTVSYAEAADAKPLFSGFMNWSFGQGQRHRDRPIRFPPESALGAHIGAGRPAVPTLVITAGCDPLRDEREAFFELLRTAGVEVEAMRFEGVCTSASARPPFSIRRHGPGTARPRTLATVSASTRIRSMLSFAPRNTPKESGADERRRYERHGRPQPAYASKQGRR